MYSLVSSFRCILTYSIVLVLSHARGRTSTVEVLLELLVRGEPVNAYGLKPAQN
jgi:hypothetical protein